MSIVFDYKGKNVVVTGGAKGLGMEIAKRYAEAGANVCIADFDQEAGEKTAEELSKYGTKMLFCRTDVSDSVSVTNMKDEVIDKFGQVDILVSNAGVSVNVTGPPFTKIPMSEYDRLYKVNVQGNINVCQAFYENFYKLKEGKIIITASISAFLPNPLMPPYSGTKSMVINLMQCLAKEMGSFNINVNCINPGVVFTDIYKKQGDLIRNLNPQFFADCESNEDIAKKVASDSALKRLQEPEDIANAVMFLSSNAARNITGKCLNVDAGKIIKF